MSRIITKGAVDQSIYVEILDSTSTTGGRKTGLVYNTASLTGYYVRNGGSATAITLATLAAANSAHSDGGFKEVDATNMPGVYRLDLPDAAVASGADSVVVTLKGATGMAQVSAEIQLTGINPQDAVRGGMTALPNAAADAAGGIPISDAGGLDLDAKVGALTFTVANKVDANATHISGDSVAADNAEAFFDGTGYAGTNNVIPTVTTVTNLTNAPTAGDFTATMKTSIGTAVAASSVASVTGNVGGNVAGSVASVTGNVGGNVVGSVGSLTTNNDKTGYALSATGSAAMTEGYAALGAAGTLPQILYEIRALLAEKSISTTTLTTKKLDGATTAATYTLDDATTPSAITRAT